MKLQPISPAEYGNQFRFACRECGMVKVADARTHGRGSPDTGYFICGECMGIDRVIEPKFVRPRVGQANYAALEARVDTSDIPEANEDWFKKAKLRTPSDWRPCARCTNPMDCGSWASCHNRATRGWADYR